MRGAWLALALAGCAPVATEESAIPERGAGATCRALDPSRFVGRPATAELAGQARRASGAARVRWLQPGTIVTMEYRADRLNIHLDGENRVTRLACG